MSCDKSWKFMLTTTTKMAFHISFMDTARAKKNMREFWFYFLYFSFMPLLLLLPRLPSFFLLSLGHSVSYMTVSKKKEGLLRRRECRLICWCVFKIKFGLCFSLHEKFIMRLALCQHVTSDLLFLCVILR